MDQTISTVRGTLDSDGGLRDQYSGNSKCPPTRKPALGIVGIISATGQVSFSLEVTHVGYCERDRNE